MKLIIKKCAVTDSSRCRILFTTFWCFGLLLGVYLVSFLPPGTFPLIRAILLGQRSAIGLIVVLIVPFLLFTMAVSMYAPIVLYTISFLFACSFSFSSVAISVVFGNAAWLVRCFVLFSTNFLAILVFGFGFRHSAGPTSSIRQEVAICSIIIALIGMIDYCVIAPFWVNLSIQ